MTGTENSTGVRYTHVLVPLDGSSFADAAVPTARALAARFGAELHAVTVADDAAEADWRRQHAQEVLGQGAGERVHVMVGDDPTEAIERRVAELGSCLVCLSTHGRGRVSGAVIGSVARSLLQRSDEPLVAVGPIAQQRTSEGVDPLSVLRLVASVDGSRASESVLPVAAAWARTLGMSLTIVTVAEPVPPPLRPDANWTRRHGPDADADEYVARLADGWRATVPDVSGHVQYDPISPAEGIGTYLDDFPAGLAAVTTHARSGLGRLLVGATAASIVRASVAPVLVVPVPHRS